MQAIVQDAYGSSDGFRSSEIDRPEIAANEVLIDVAAARLAMSFARTAALVPKEEEGPW